MKLLTNLFVGNLLQMVNDFNLLLRFVLLVGLLNLLPKLSLKVLGHRLKVVLIDRLRHSGGQLGLGLSAKLLSVAPVL